MPIVYVVNEPLSPDPDNPGQMRRTKNLRPASAFGELRFLLPAGHPPTDSEAVAAALRHGLRDVSEEDFLVLVGDIGACAMAATIYAARCGGTLRWLRWYNPERRYIPERVTVFTAEQEYEQ